MTCAVFVAVGFEWARSVSAPDLRDDVLELHALSGEVVEGLWVCFDGC